MKSRRIVLALSDDRLAAQITEQLKAEGWSPIVFSSGSDALDSCVSQPPELVITEHPVQLSTTRTLTRALKTSPETWNVPIVAVPRHCIEGSIANAYRDGADCCINRPIDPGRIRKEALRLTGSADG